LGRRKKKLKERRKQEEEEEKKYESNLDMNERKGGRRIICFLERRWEKGRIGERMRRQRRSGRRERK
jgi:hypothetical protein